MYVKTFARLHQKKIKTIQKVLFFVMQHHGEKLRRLLKAKGYDIKNLANELNVTRVAIERDLKRADLTRRTLSKYVGILFDDFDDFYEEESKVNTILEDGSRRNQDAFTELQTKYIELQSKFIELQEKHLRLTERFFPNAVQQAIITA